MQLKTVQWNVIIIIIIIVLSSLLLLLSLLLLSMMVLFVGFTCPPTIHFKFVTKYDSVFYYKVRQLFFITECDKCYYKVPQLNITKCNEQTKQ